MSDKKLSPNQKRIAKEWYDHTGWRFMPPAKGETFVEAILRNRKWLEDHTADAMFIGESYIERYGAAK